jgi:hypothetical protein
MKQKHPRTQDTIEPLLTVRDVCDRFSVSKQWVYRHKEVPRQYVGGQLRFSESAMRDHFSKQALKH